MLKDTITLINIPSQAIQNQAALNYALMTTREYFSDCNDMPPPIPDDVLSFVPCNLLITEPAGVHKERLGRIQFTKDDGTVCFDKNWKIA